MSLELKYRYKVRGVEHERDLPRWAAVVAVVMLLALTVVPWALGWLWIAEAMA